MTDVHIYINKPAGKDLPTLEEVGDAVSELGCVSGVRADALGSVIAVSFEGGTTERSSTPSKSRDTRSEGSP